MNITWNNQVRIIISDVDETVADLFTAATAEMIEQLESLLNEGKIIFFITGQSALSVNERIGKFISPKLRRQILIGQCSGAEVLGYDNNGELLQTSYYSLYEKTLDERQRTDWRRCINQVIDEFKLTTHKSIPVNEFIEQTNGHPLHIMYDDRRSQITFECINAYKINEHIWQQIKQQLPDLQLATDLRLPIITRAEQLFSQYDIPITPRLAGEFAIDFALAGVSKTTAIKTILTDSELWQKNWQINISDVTAEQLEIWGDKFSLVNGGTDRHMCAALPTVRAIDFRRENIKELPTDFNIVLWTGQRQLHDGLLEYLQGR